MSNCRSIWRSIFLALAFAANTVSADAAEVRSFTAQSFQEIRAANKARPLVVAFWSVNCEPCKEEMTALTELHRAFPSVKVIIVAADSPELRPAVLRFLGRYELGKIESWQFGDEPEERLRYSVDHTWRGELPRAFFIGANGEITTQSGVPEKKWMETWFKTKSSAAKAPAP